MLSIILTILKIIGLILVVILGILLLVIAAILWVPFRYRIVASKYEDMKANVKLSWLCRLIYITFGYDGGKPRFVIRIFGFALIDSNRPKKVSKKKKGCEEKYEKVQKAEKAGQRAD